MCQMIFSTSIKSSEIIYREMKSMNTCSLDSDINENIKKQENIILRKLIGRYPLPMRLKIARSLKNSINQNSFQDADFFKLSDFTGQVGKLYLFDKKIADIQLKNDENGCLKMNVEKQYFKLTKKNLLELAKSSIVELNIEAGRVTISKADYLSLANNSVIRSGKKADLPVQLVLNYVDNKFYEKGNLFKIDLALNPADCTLFDGEIVISRDRFGFKINRNMFFLDSPQRKEYESINNNEISGRLILGKVKIPFNELYHLKGGDIVLSDNFISNEFDLLFDDGETYKTEIIVIDDELVFRIKSKKELRKNRIAQSNSNDSDFLKFKDSLDEMKLELSLKTSGSDKPKDVGKEVAEFKDFEIEDHQIPKIFEIVSTGDSQVLYTFLKKELPQTIAFILSQLGSKKSAEILEMFPEDLKTIITNKMVSSKAALGDAGREVERILERKLATEASADLIPIEGVSKTKEILKNLSGDGCKNILA